ncbi:MAG: ATP synthase F1 subunit gamma [Candidatus Puniceispirillum sp.]|nr:ATP synthase F1 subunit gamma [Candidatus Pelagibacter sp.]MBA4282948.1 ATP synthase F1 subunit gamma [Candidatus Puniceispirillum sp.]
MATLKELKNRIKAIKSTKKITSAMKLIATARLKKNQITLNNARAYCSFYDFVFKELNSTVENKKRFSLFFKEDKNLPHLIVGIGSNKGLCGSYNYNILREVQEEFKKRQAYGQRVLVVLLGKKLEILAKGTSVSNLSPFVIYELKKSTDLTDEKNIDLLASHIQDLFMKNEIGGLSIVTGHLVNLLQQPPKLYSIIPCEFKYDNSVEKKELKEVIFEPSYKEFIPIFLKQYINDKLMQLIRENLVCENASRMNAMDSSSKNANDMIKTLEIEYNRGRQSLITRELIEIISGSNSI